MSETSNQNSDQSQSAGITELVKRYFPTIIGVVIIVLIVVFATRTQPAQAPAGEEDGTTTTRAAQNPGSAVQDDVMPEGEGGRYAGILKTSDNAARGQLMLITPSHVIYLRTSRDFSAFVDKNVVVTIEGELENFRLLDIKAE